MIQQRGRFIVLEGLEGAGKSTVLQGIARHLTDQHIDFVQTREPGGTKIGETLRALIKSGLEEERLLPQSELLLIYAARIQLLTQVIQPTLASGRWVICDRFELSTYAYQGGGRQLDLHFIDQLSHFCLHGFQPDCLFFLDVSPDIGLSRAKQRGAYDHIEQESQVFFTRVHQMYHERLAQVPGARCINAALPFEQVMHEVVQALEQLKGDACSH